MRIFPILALLAAMAATALGCAATVKDGGQAAVPHSDFSVDGLLITFTTDKEDYREGEPVNATATFTNCSDGILKFPVGEDGDGKLFFDVILVSNISAVYTIHNGSEWTNDRGKSVGIITLRKDEKHQLYIPAIVPGGDGQGGYSSLFRDETFKMFIVYRDYSWGHTGKKIYARNPEGKYWEGVCISKPVTITFGLEDDRPDDGD